MDNPHLSMRLLNRPLALLPSFAAVPQREAQADPASLLGALAQPHGEDDGGAAVEDMSRQRGGGLGVRGAVIGDEELHGLQRRTAHPGRHQ